MYGVLFNSIRVLGFNPCLGPLSTAGGQPNIARNIPQ